MYGNLSAKSLACGFLLVSFCRSSIDQSCLSGLCLQQPMRRAKEAEWLNPLDLTDMSAEKETISRVSSKPFIAVLCQSGADEWLRLDIQLRITK